MVDSGAAGTPTDTASRDSADTGDAPLRPDAPVTLYAVRHAEKGTGSDPDLTKEGHARAAALATLLHEVELHAAYATSYLRTQQTVQPTADDHGLAVNIDFDGEEDLAQQLALEHGGDTVVHAGHTNTLPDLFRALGAETWDGVDGYGQVWILVLDEAGHVDIEMSSYGE